MTGQPVAVLPAAIPLLSAGRDLAPRILVRTIAVTPLNSKTLHGVPDTYPFGL